MPSREELTQMLQDIPVDRTVKRQAWDTFRDAKTPEEFYQGTQNIPPGVRNQLYEMKFGAPPVSGKTPLPSIPGTPELPPVAEAAKQGKLTLKDLAATGINAIPTIGGAAGAITGEAVLPTGGGIPGAAMGGAAGEAIKEAIVSKVGADKLSGPNVPVDQPPGTTSEVQNKILTSGGEQALQEFGGRVMASGVRALAAGPLHGAAGRAENLAVKEFAQKSGLRLTGPEMAGNASRASRAFHTAQRLGEYSFFAQKYIESAREAGVDKALGYLDEQLDKLHPPTSPVQAGEAAQEAFKTSHQIFRETANRYYEVVDQEAKGVMVNMRGVKAEARRLLADDNELRSYYAETGKVGPEAAKILNDAAKQPDQVPFTIAQKWRTKLMGATPDPTEFAANEKQGIAKKFVSDVTESMDNSASALNPKARDAWEAARRFYKDGMEMFDSATIRKLMDSPKGPEMIASEIKYGDVTKAKLIRRAILDYPTQYGDPAQKQVADLTWRQFQEQFVRSSLLENPEGLGGGVGVQKLMEDPAGMKKRLEKLGPGVLKEIFGSDPAGKEILQNVRDMSEAMARMEKLPTEGRRFVYDIISAVAGLGGAFSGHGEAGVGAGVAFEILPLLVSGSMHNRRAAMALVDGFGGILKTFENPLLKRAGGVVVNLSDRTVTSPASYKFGGKVMADFGRAWSIVQDDRAKMAQKAEKAATAMEDNDPLIAPFQ